jgi:colanic acid biosynthesis glycosyl transferase WcaI
MIIAGDGFSKKLILSLSRNFERIINLPLQPKNRLDEFLRLADVHLLPQKKEIADYVMPSKLLGIMASSRPVVVGSPKNSDLGKVADRVGIRVDPEDAKDFAKAVRLLLQNKNLREFKGMEAFKFVRENFYKETVLKSFLKEVRKLEKKNYINKNSLF